MIALAYAITGVAVAAALVAIVGSTTGLFGADTEPAPATLLAGPAIVQTEATHSGIAVEVPAPEVVYVDAPAPGRGHADDDDDDREERHEREHEEHDDD